MTFLMLNAKKGISSLNVQRIMGFKKKRLLGICAIAFARR